MTDHQQTPETSPSASSAPPGSSPPWAAATSAFTRWRDGEQDALDQLVRLLSPVLWQVVRATGLDQERAEDVVQTTWLAFMDHAEQIEKPEAVAGWLCTTARRAGWRTAKQSGRQLPTSDEVLHERLPRQPGPEGQVILDDESAQLWSALARLPERCQSLLRLVAAEARPDYAEVSRALGMPIGSIGPTRGRCLDKLRRELAPTGGFR